MKTKELIRLLSDYAEIFDQNEGVIMGMHWTVDKNIQRLRIFGPTPRVVSDWLGEYTATPIEEREDEKKYYICIGIDKYHILTKETLNNFFFFWSNYNSWGNFQAEFTQSEIDKFPPEIKGAIECGFLKKVEVEE